MICYNGEFIKRKSINIDNRGLKYGDCFFETIKCFQGKPLFWEDHYFRMASSFGMLNMIPPSDFSIENFKTLINSLLAKLGLNIYSARIRILFYRNGSGYYKPNNNNVDYIISAQHLDNYQYKSIDQGLNIGIYKENNISSGPLSTIKSNNRLINVLASIYSEEHGLDDCILINENKMIAETTLGNIFIVYKNKLLTPPLCDGCIDGVLRKNIIALKDFSIQEKSLSFLDVLNAEEVFTTNVIKGVSWVSKCNNKIYKKSYSVNIINSINKKFFNLNEN